MNTFVSGEFIVFSSDVFHFPKASKNTTMKRDNYIAQISYEAI